MSHCDSNNTPDLPNKNKMNQTISKAQEETEAADRWHLWCRLCAKEDLQGNISCSREEDQRNTNANLLAAVGLYFSVNIADDEMLPKMLCVECRTLMNSLVTFHKRVAKVQEMFSTLQLAKEREHIDLHTIRLNYGLLDNQSLLKITYCATGQNINLIDSKAEPVEQSDPLKQANVNIKTEHDDDLSNNGSIDLESVHDCSDNVESTAIANNDIECLVEFSSESKRDSHSSPFPKRPRKNLRSSASDYMQKFAKDREHFDLHTIRLKYGLLDNQPLPEINYCATKQNVNEIDRKAVPVDRSDPQKQANFDIKSDDDDDVLINGSIGVEKVNDCSDNVESTECLVEMRSERGFDFNDERDSDPSTIKIPKSPRKNAITSDIGGHKKFQFICEVCKMQFAHKSKLIRHSRVHKEKVHACKYCHLVFAELYNLNNHIRTIHFDANVATLQEKDDDGGEYIEGDYNLKPQEEATTNVMN